jgi:predicted NBD/HSP70 family sugar kinase
MQHAGRTNGPDEEKDAEPASGKLRIGAAAQNSLTTLLNLVRTGAATTRHELERQAELGRAIVSDRLAVLIRLGLVEEGELGQAIGGRAPRHVRFRTRAGAILAAVLDHSSLAVGISDLSGRLLAEHHEAVELASGPQPVVERMSALFNWMLEEHGAGSAVWGVGLAASGPVNKPSDQHLFAPVLSAFRNWDGFPFVEELALRVGAPVWVRSSVQTMTMGEFRSGSGVGVTDMIFVKLGRSIGAGVISQGVLHRGAQGAAGLIGHTWVEGQSLEAVAGSDAIAREARQAAESRRSPYLAGVLARTGTVTVTDTGHGAQLGDNFCIELLARCGRAVGEALAPLANLLNPSLIVLGGSVAQTGDILLAAVREAVYRQSHPLVTRDLRILRSQMSGSAGLVGCAQVVAEALFESRFLQGWVTLGSPRAHPESRDFLTRAAAAMQQEPQLPKPPGSAVA